MKLRIIEKEDWKTTFCCTWFFGVCWFGYLVSM